MAINEEVDLENITIDANISSGMSISSVGVGGPRGEKGDKGDKGDTGAAGPANTLTIGTVTKGDEADATITGEAPNQTLNLTLPKGDKGDKGDKGENGDTGPEGPQGADGEDAKINGVNTLSIEAGTNITLDQEGDTLTINSTGGSGNYPDLTNKPKINNVELNGNKTSSDLGLQPAGDYQEQLTAGSGINIKSIYHPVLPSGYTQVEYLENEPEKAATINLGVGSSILVNVEMDCQMDSALTAGNSILIYKTTSAGGYFGSKGATCYWGTGGTEDNANTDIICTERVTANLTFSANGRVTSGTINGQNFTRAGGSGSSSNSITLGHSTLLPGFKVWSLIVKNENNEILFNGIPCKNEQNIYGLYDIVSNTFKSSETEDQFTGSSKEIISSKLIELEEDLSKYVTNTDYATSSTGGVIKVDSYSVNTNQSGQLYAKTNTYENYQNLTNGHFISKGTLENVITGKGLVSNTDYADSDTGGVIKIGSSYGTAKSSSGNLIASVKNYEDYSSAGNYMFVGKGTLENVITGKGLVDQTALSGKQDTLTAGTGINITNNVISATGGGGGGVGNNVFYGTCATGASTAAKVVVCEDFTASELVAGTRLTVLFTNGNSYNGQATLNVNGTGAKDIYYNGTTTNSRYMWVAGESVEFVYNGGQWATVNGGLATTSYYGVTKLATGANSDSQAYALTPRSLYYFGNYSIAPYYSTSSTYAVGDKVRYSYYIYECITAIDTPEAWTAEHWQQIDTLQEQIDGKQDVLTAGTGISINNNVISATGGGGASTLTITVTYSQQEADEFTWSGATINEIESAYNSGTEIYIPTRYMGTVKVTNLSGDSQELYMTALYTGYQTCTFLLKSDGTGEVYWYELAQEQTLQDVEDSLSTRINNKQDKLTAGNNITISNGTISATDTTYTAGSNISITNGSISASVPTVVQATGTSTTNVMSQDAVTDALDDLALDIPTITLSTTDIGEGVSLAANTLYGVYQ